MQSKISMLVSRVDLEEGMSWRPFVFDFRDRRTVCLVSREVAAGA